MDNKMEDIVSTAQQWAQNNRGLIRGYGFLILGLILLWLTFKIILNMLLFGAGILLLQDACRQLQFTTISNFFDKIFSFLRCNCNTK